MIDLSGYVLTFDEEFNRRSISQTGAGTTWADIRQEWRFDAASDIGFGHSSFVDPASGYDPFDVSGGKLTITAVPDRTASGFPGSWESGLITTQGTFSQAYGYFEVRADFSDMPGAWDAFWLLPDRQIPDPNKLGRGQELDVVEHYGDWDRGVYSRIHTSDLAPNQHWQQNLQVYSELGKPSGYHTYGVSWQPDRITFYVDGQAMGSQATPSDMHAPMFILANLAVQDLADAAHTPITSSIDYIRVFSADPAAVAVTQDRGSSPDGSDPGLYGATARQAAASSTTTDPQSLFGALTHETGSAGGKVYALYDALLGRAPDVLGLEHWADAFAHGTASTTLAAAFLASAEGQARSGAADNATFVTQLYNATLHRNPDAAGLADWTGKLNAGTSRAEVGVGFALSAEHLASVQPALDAGLFVPDADAAAVARVYYTMLSRAPDAAGLKFWTDAVKAGTPLTAETQTFLNLPEAQAKVAGLTTAQYVDLVYTNALGRHAEADGLAFWTGAIDGHAASRVDVTTQIGQSTEAQLHLAPLIEQGWHLA